MSESEPQGQTGTCPHCGEEATYNRAGGIVDGSDVWHESCWYKAKHGFEDTNGDAPQAPNPNKPFNLHRTVETEICGEVFEWDEYLYTHMYADHGRYNLPTRDELTPPQLETLREWATGENPTGDEQTREGDFRIGVFPARVVLIGGYGSDAPYKWICPGCGEVVRVDISDHEIDLHAECGNCGSDKWLTAGEPIEETGQDAFGPLSDRERQVIRLDIVGRHTDKEMADALDVQPSTIREYRERAKAKAWRGKELYDKMDAFDVLGDD